MRESAGQHVDQPQPRGIDGLEKQDVSQSVNICAHHTNTHPISVKLMHSIFDDCPLSEKPDIHEIS